jgi:hypothetical protein
MGGDVPSEADRDANARAYAGAVHALVSSGHGTKDHIHRTYTWRQFTRFVDLAAEVRYNQFRDDYRLAGMIAAAMSGQSPDELPEYQPAKTGPSPPSTEWEEAAKTSRWVRRVPASDGGAKPT